MTILKWNSFDMAISKYFWKCEVYKMKTECGRGLSGTQDTHTQKNPLS